LLLLPLLLLMLPLVLVLLATLKFFHHMRLPFPRWECRGCKPILLANSFGA
jgi:hypothetical protein